MTRVLEELAAGPLNEQHEQLTDVGLIQLDYIAPPAELHPFVTTLYYFRCEETDIHDIQPAAVGSMIVFLRGEGHMQFGDRIDPSHPVSLLAPTSFAVPFEVDGPFHCIGAALSPLGWAALTRLNADEHHDRLIDASAVLGEDVTKLGASLREQYSTGSTPPGQLCAQLAAFIGARLKPVNKRHVELIMSVTAWMSSDYNPRIEDLAQTTGYSVRQVQRLVERYFGVTPKLLIRKYRALRVAALMQDSATSDEMIAGLINLFYDQSHLIREIRTFAGRTPTRLGDEKNPILGQLLDLKNFREIKPNIAKIPGD